MFSIIFCKVSMLDNVKERLKWLNKRFSLLTGEVSNDGDETVSQIGKH